jgi:hypothetical protein
MKMRPPSSHWQTCVWYIVAPSMNHGCGVIPRMSFRITVRNRIVLIVSAAYVNDIQTHTVLELKPHVRDRRSPVTATAESAMETSRSIVHSV